MIKIAAGYMRAAILICLANNIVGLTLTLLRADKGCGMFLNQTQSGSRKKIIKTSN